MLFKIRNGPGTKTGTGPESHPAWDEMRLVGSTFRQRVGASTGHMYCFILSILCVTQEINTWANVYGYNKLNFTFTDVIKSLT